MKYCKKCGTELKEGVEFCPSCGAETRETDLRYVRPKGSWTAVKVILALFGGFMILVGVPLIFSGSTLMAVTNELDTGSGYIGVKGVDMDTGTQVLVFKNMDVGDMVFEEFDHPSMRFWAPDLEDMVGVRFMAESNNGKELFIGLMEADDAMDYLRGVEYEYVTNFRMEEFDDTPDIDYRTHSGEALTVPPGDVQWVIQATGTDIENLQWTPEYGEYWFVVMNTDLSPGVDFDGGVGVKIPLLSSIGKGLLVSGLLCFGVGAVVIYMGVIRPRN